MKHGWQKADSLDILDEWRYFNDEWCDFGHEG